MVSCLNSLPLLRLARSRAQIPYPSSLARSLMPKFPTPPPSRAVSGVNSLPLLRLARSRAQIPCHFLFGRPPCGLHKSIPRRPIPYRKCRRAFQGALYLKGSVEEHSKVPFTLPEVQESVMINMFIPTESQVFLSPSPVKKTPINIVVWLMCCVFVTGSSW